MKKDVRNNFACLVCDQIFPYREMVKKNGKRINVCTGCWGLLQEVEPPKDALPVAASNGKNQ